MDCPGCGKSDSMVPKTIDGSRVVVRARRCRACRGLWRTREIIEKGSFKLPGEKPYTAGQGKAAGGFSPNGGTVGGSVLDLSLGNPSLGTAPSEPPDQTRARRGRPSATEYPAEFEQIWDGCKPRKGNKHPAFKAWVKFKPEPNFTIRIYQARLRTDQWQRGYIPNLSTWLNEKGWETEPDPSEFVSKPDRLAEPLAVRVERERSDRHAAEWEESVFGEAVSK